MKAGMRMLAVNNARRNRERMEMERGSGGNMEMRGGQMQNEMRDGGMEYGRMGGEEMRRGGGGRMEMRGERNEGRMNYEGGRMGNENYPEARFRDRQGRDRYNDGRYAPQNNRGGNRGGELRYPYWPPIYERDSERMEQEGSRMNRIGFDMTGRREIEYGSEDEMQYRRGREPQRGKAEHHMIPEFDMETAKEWVESMHNEDGSTGAHWTMEQIKPIMQQKGVDVEPEEFWAIMNAMYSDYCKVAKKHNVSTVDFYADMAKAWLDDKDAVEDKAAAYYEHIVKRK